MSAWLDPDEDGSLWPEDCDSSDPAIHPGVSERCDGVDNDCDDDIDDQDEEGLLDAEGELYYRDADDDGYGDQGDSRRLCASTDGYVGGATDCDDRRPDVHPGAAELCDDLDNDCDEGADDEDLEGPVDPATWHADADSDTYGDPAAVAEACEAPVGHVTDANDCDDMDVQIHPGADEICDNLDNDCDGGVDDEDAEGPVDPAAWNLDADGDTYGDPATTAESCEAPERYVADSDEVDCDDLDAQVNPGAAELCDDLDNDCDGGVDDEDPEGAVDPATWYVDADGDTYGDPATAADACDASVGEVADATDCDDADATIYPGAESVAEDGRVNDCSFWDPDEVDGEIAERHVHRLSGELDADDAEAIIDGVTEGAQIGHALAMLDLDGDLDLDLLAGAPTYAGSAAYEGAIYALTGPVSAGSATFGDSPVLTGGVEQSRLGSSLAPVADLDGDGLDELLVGAPAPLGTSGVAWLSYGPLAALDVEIAATGYDEVGEAVASADLDGDGVSELIVGTGHADGAAWIFPASELASSAVTLDPTPSFAGSGSDAAGAALAPGDLDGDGVLELAVGAPGADAVYLIVSPKEGDGLGPEDADAGWVGPSGSFAGAALTLLDLDGDGGDDLVIGAYKAEEEVGCVYAVLGPLTGSGDLSDADWSRCGGDDEHYLGDAVGSPGDLDLDGSSDLALGARGWVTDDGAATLLYGPLDAGAFAEEANIRGEDTSSSLGAAFAGGDLTGDGAPDLAVGAYGSDEVEDKAGALWLLCSPGI